MAGTDAHANNSWLNPCSAVGKRVFVLVGLVILIMATATVATAYLQTRKPLTRIIPDAQVIEQVVPPRYLFSIYHVNEPFGVATSPDGNNIYVTELGGERELKVFDRSGNLVNSSNPTDSVVPGRAPLYISVNADGMVFVADRNRHGISIYSPDGKYLREFLPNGDSNFVWNPIGSTFDKDGNFYVTDVTGGQHRVLVFNPSGALIREFGKQGTGPGEFMFPNGVAVASDGRIFVANGNLGRVDIFNNAGSFLSTFAQGTSAGSVGIPRGLAIQGDRLYVVDTAGHMVQVFSIVREKPTYLFSLGGQGNKDGQLSFPNGVALDVTGRVYVADRKNNRVQVWSY